MQEQGAGFWLSPQQQFAWKLEHETLRSASRAACLISLAGAVNLSRVRDALREIVSRHEILRTVFHRQTGIKVPFQFVREDTEIDWTESDCSSLAPLERHADMEKRWEEEQTHAHNLSQGPTLRAVLIKQTPDRFALIVSVPSLCADARSLVLLSRELGLIYSGQRHELAEPFRYVQFAQWQADLLESAEPEAEQARRFWNRQRETSLASPALPAKSGSDDAVFEPRVVRGSVRNDVAAAALRRGESSTVFVSAWESLLSRLSGQSAFSVGYFATSREYEELENAIGRFGRTLPISARVENDFRFSDVLRQADAAVREATNAQEYFTPEAIAHDRDLVSFSYCDLGGAQEQGGVRWELERVRVVSERSKLRLGVARRGSELELEFHYDANRLERRAVERIASCYQNLLAAALVNPEAWVAALPLLSEAERQQIVVEWNQTAAVYPAEQCVQELFEQQAARTPEREAVRGEDLGYSYRELNERANRLAHYLRKRGVGPDQRVGLCVDRTADSLVAVLAILKAGGAYVPLQADHPAARLGQQLQGAVALITEAKFTAQMPPFPGPMVVLDGDQTQWASEPPTNLEKNTTPENLVYVIFTSGSTGVPKGVAVRHRNLVNYADDICKRLRLQDDKDKEGLQFATVSTLAADLGNTCIYPALISGGCVHLVSYERATDARAFAEYVRRHPLDVLKIVPSHLGALLQSDEAAHLLPRKYLILGGEALTPQLLEKIASFHPTCEIVNHYGPTETTVGSLTLQLKDYDWRQANLASIPIGRPIQNTQVYILDANLQPVPVGVTGELYIAGAGVTAGYVEQAEKTAERFVNNPFAHDADSSAKMYRTGDLARYGEDGKVEFIGRGDDQVKVRGFRIELGEIETVLARHAGVKQALVVARADEQGEKRLVGYVVGKRELGNEITGEGLRTYLKQQLPEYMVPQALVVLPKMPLNANGKIDRRALPEPEAAGATHAYVAPRSQTERAIAQIWAEVLRRDPNSIGVEDNFFDLGGHSLLATQVISRLRQQFSVEIPMRVIFDRSQVSRLAEAIEQARENSADDGQDLGIASVSREAYRA